jgi:hypothetical protein
MAKFNKEGHQIPDTTPVEVPIHIQPLTPEQKLASAVAIELSRREEEKDGETFMDSQDFDIDEEENDPITQFENMAEMQEEFLDTENIDFEQRVDALTEYTNEQLAKEMERRQNATQEKATPEAEPDERE